MYISANHHSRISMDNGLILVTVHRREIGWQNQFYTWPCVENPTSEIWVKILHFAIEGAPPERGCQTTLGRRTAAAIVSGYPLGRSSAFVSVRESIAQAVGPNVHLS